MAYCGKDGIVNTSKVNVVSHRKNAGVSGDDGYEGACLAGRLSPT